MRLKAAASAIVLALVVLTARAAADPTPVEQDPPIHFVHGVHVLTPGGADLTLPPGYYLSEPAYDKVDAEVRRLQDAETRLTAENGALKHDVERGSSWWVVAAGIVSAGLGALAAHYL